MHPGVSTQPRVRPPGHPVQRLGSRDGGRHKRGAGLGSAALRVGPAARSRVSMSSFFAGQFFWVSCNTRRAIHGSGRRRTCQGLAEGRRYNSKSRFASMPVSVRHETCYESENWTLKLPAAVGEGSSNRRIAQMSPCAVDLHQSPGSQDIA